MTRPWLLLLLLAYVACAAETAPPQEENKKVKVAQGTSPASSSDDIADADADPKPDPNPDPTPDPDPTPQPQPNPNPQPNPQPQPSPTNPHQNAEGLGNACTACKAGQYCLTSDGEKYCSRDCTQASPCPAYWECVGLQGGGNTCVKSDQYPIDNPTPPVAAEAVLTTEDPKNGQNCATQSCGTGFSCVTSGTTKTCAKTCKRDIECPAARVCDHFQPDVSLCWPGAPPATVYAMDRDCTQNCSTIETFWEPHNGDGYLVTHSPQYSFLRKDSIMFIRYAARMVEDYMPSPHGDLALMDMGQADGNVPGADQCGCTRADVSCSENCNKLRHPYGSHMDGFDLDVAYYQNAQNAGREVCGNNGQFCTATPNMDYRRTAYFFARLYETGRVRVIGVDTAIAAPLKAAADQLVTEGWISTGVRKRFDSAIAYGNGWPFHFHHFHVSFAPPLSSGPGRDEPAFLPHPLVGCGFDLDKHGTGF